MRYARLSSAITLAIASPIIFAQTSNGFTLQQALSAPYANQLTAAPVGNFFAWVEDEEGRHNLYIGGKDVPARALTRNADDDAQDISGIVWSPEGMNIAYVYGAPSGADGKPANPAHLQYPTPVRVMLVSTDGKSQPETVAEGRAPIFTRDGHALLFVHEGQIWTTCLEDCKDERAEKSGLPYPTQLASHQLVYDRGSAGSLTISPDGHTLAFISRRREVNEPSHSFLALYDLEKKTLTFPAPSTGDDSAPAFSPDGKQIAWIRNPFTEIPEFANPRVSATPWSIQLLDVASGASRTVYSLEPNKMGSVLSEPSGVPLLFVDAHHLVFYTEQDGYLHLAVVDPASGAMRVITKGTYEADQAVYDSATRKLYFAANFGGRSDGRLDVDLRHIMSYSLLDSGEKEPNDESHMALLDDAGKIAVPNEANGLGMETHPAVADGVVAGLASSDRWPLYPAVFGFPLPANKPWFRSLSSSQPAHYPSKKFVTPMQVMFGSSDGLHLHGQLFLPEREADSSAALRNDKEKSGGDAAKINKHPALIFVHGGPKRQMLLGYPEMEYYSNAYAMNQYLASRGFVVLSVNYRCGTGYGLEFRTCQSAGATGATEYNDVLAAQKYLASRADVDVKRIGIWGGSYGGYLTALALSRNSDLFAAGVDFHGVHDWNLEDNAGDWKRGTFAQQDAIGTKALASSPLADLSKWRSPILLIHGDNDPNVAYAQTPVLADALRARNASLPKEQQVDVEELVFPDELHEFVLHKDWLAAYTATAAFFERTLKP